MLQQGLVHIPGLHLATSAAPQENEKAARKILSERFEMIRLARWQESVALAPATDLQSLRSIGNAKLNWIGRERGSGARECQDRFPEHRQEPAGGTTPLDRLRVRRSSHPGRRVADHKVFGQNRPQPPASWPPVENRQTGWRPGREHGDA